MARRLMDWVCSDFGTDTGHIRSGVTITVALMVGLNRLSAARFSFLLSIPAIAGAQMLLTRDLVLPKTP